MTRLKYLDPADGQYKFVPIGSSVEEVEVSATQPTATPKPELWMDTAALDPTGPQGGNALDQATADTLYLRLVGGSLVGPLVLSADPAAAMQPATRQYVDARPGRNAIRNGDMGIAQRGNGPYPGGAYSVDGWYVYGFGSGGTFTFNRVAQATGLGSPFLQTTISGLSGGATDQVYAYQAIEDWQRLTGKTVTVSFDAVAASGTPKIGVEFYQYFGSGGSPSATVHAPAGAVTISTTKARYSITGTVPSIVGKTLGTSGNSAMDLWFWFSAGANNATNASNIGTQNNMFSITDVQLEEGSTATPYERLSSQTQLSWCQRYYHRVQQSSGGPTRTLMGIATSTTAWSGIYYLPVPMRALPTMLYGGATISLSDGTAYGQTSVNPSVWSATSSGSVPVNQIGIQTTAGTGTLTQYRTYFLEWSSGTGAGYIEFSAEL
jgi:hypothetical protein